MIDIEQRITAAIERITSGNAPMRVPADETDPDLVLADCLAEIRRLRAALAARQPVSETDAYQQGFRDGQDRTCTVAARQPVGEPITVEAVAEIFNHPEYGLSIDWLLENGIGELQVGDVLMVSDRAITDEDGSGEVYTAPPAQAVDLDELRRAACVVNVVGQIDGHDVVRRDSVLDVIDTRRQRLLDSQEVGNG